MRHEFKRELKRWLAESSPKPLTEEAPRLKPCDPDRSSRIPNFTGEHNGKKESYVAYQARTGGP